jgi:hypothetical protein
MGGGRSGALASEFLDVGVGVSSSQANDPIEVLPRPLDVALFPIQVAALAVGRQVLRIEPDGLIEVLESVLGLECLPVATAAIGEGYGKISGATSP